jgi:hypothetical protein
MKMKVSLIEFGKVNENGRTYLHHQMSYLPPTVMCTIDHHTDSRGLPDLNPTLDGNNTCALANISMDVNGVYAEVNPFSERKDLFHELMMYGCKIVPVGTGHLNENNEVEDYRLHYVYLTKNSA